MKTKKILVIFAAVMLGFFLLGSSGVIHMADDSLDGGFGADDRLIGVLITTEHLDLFDFEGYLEDNREKILSGSQIDQSQWEKYQGRLYATFVDKSYTHEETGEVTVLKEFVFDGVSGIRYFAATISDESGSYVSSCADQAISDGHMEVSATDQGEDISLEGTVYVSTVKGPRVFYINPVYQSLSGEVYVTAGNGMTFSGEKTEGLSHSTELESQISYTSEGKEVATKSYVKINITYVDPPEKLSVVQFYGHNQIKSRSDYSPGALPKTFETHPETEYIILETWKTSSDKGQSLTRELYQASDETMCAFYCRDDGICVKQSSCIRWDF